MKAAMKAALAAALLSLTASTSASAFLCTRTPNLGPSVAWNTRTVVLHRSGIGADLGVDADAIDLALTRGAQQWTDVDCSDMQVVLGAPTSDLVVGFDWHAGSDDPRNQNIVIFRNGTPNDPVDEWLHTFGALAITTVTFESASGRRSEEHTSELQSH